MLTNVHAELLEAVSEAAYQTHWPFIPESDPYFLAAPVRIMHNPLGQAYLPEPPEGTYGTPAEMEQRRQDDAEEQAELAAEHAQYQQEYQEDWGTGGYESP